MPSGKLTPLVRDYGSATSVCIYRPNRSLSRMRVSLDGTATDVLLFSDDSRDQCFSARATHATNRNMKRPSFGRFVCYPASSDAFEARGSFDPRKGNRSLLFKFRRVPREFLPRLCDRVTALLWKLLITLMWFFVRVYTYVRFMIAIIYFPPCGTCQGCSTSSR